VQNDMANAVIWSKSNSEVECQYSGHLIFENGYNYISAAD